MSAATLLLLPRQQWPELRAASGRALASRAEDRAGLALARAKVDAAAASRIEFSRCIGGKRRLWRGGGARRGLCDETFIECVCPPDLA